MREPFPTRSIWGSNQSSPPNSNKSATSFSPISATSRDPRVERTRDHKLIDIIAIAIGAVISGASGWQGMEDYDHSKRQWLEQFLELPKGIPSDDTCTARL